MVLPLILTTVASSGIAVYPWGQIVHAWAPLPGNIMPPIVMVQPVLTVFKFLPIVKGCVRVCVRAHMCTLIPETAIAESQSHKKWAFLPA